MIEKLKRLQIAKCAKFLAALPFVALVSSPSHAQFAPSPCDTSGYYQSLEARAWLEAQREITQNQNLIYKPDSVLEYTCFDNHLRELANHAQTMFSESTRWGTVVPNTSMDNALNQLVSAALVRYDNANFSHSLLGGRLSATGGWGGSAPAEATGPTYAFEASVAASQPYACDMMQAIWMRAKCMNFAAVAAEDGFFTFDDYASDPDKRFLPARCASVGSDFTTNLDEALPAIGATTPWEHDVVQTRYDRFFPSGGGCGGGPNRVRTGLIVEDNSRAGGVPYYYREHVYLVPGCHWEPAGAGNNPSSPAGGGSCQPL